VVDKNRIRAGQTLKIVRGPFHVVVDKQNYGMDVYVESTLVKHYAVVSGRRQHARRRMACGGQAHQPDVLSPRGGQIVAADDPRTRWANTGSA